MGSSRDEHNGPSRRGHDAVTEFDLELPAHDVEELILRLVNVGGRPALGCDSLTKHAQCPSGLVSGRKDFGEIRLSALRPGESRRTIRQDNETRSRRS